MKMLKIFTLALLSVLLMPTENNAMNLNVDDPVCSYLDADAEDDKLKVSIKFKWGRPKRDCKGFWYLWTSNYHRYQFCLKLMEVDAGTGTINDEGRLEVDVLTSTLTPESLEGQFGGGQFRVEEPLVLPAEVADQLEIESYTIQPGVYPGRRC